jgi:MFS transporter, FHS family, Na+ dependent glucose transporter 1
METTHRYAHRRSATTAYFASMVMLGLTSAILGPALPKFAEHAGVSLGQAGLLFTARSLGYLLGSLYGGRAYDRLPGHRLLGAVMLGEVAMLALAPTVYRLWILAGILMVIGLAEGALDVGNNLLLMWVYREESNPYLNALHFFFGVGAFLAPILVAQSLLYTGGVAAAFWLLAIYPLPIILYLFTSRSPVALHESAQAAHGPLRWRLITLLTLVFVLYVGAEVGFSGWVYSYALAEQYGNLASAAYLTAAFWGALTVGRLLAIPIAARVSPDRILYADMFGCLVSAGVILAFQSSAGLWIGAIGLGLAMASVFPTLLAYAGQHMALTGEVTRWFFVGTGAGGMILPWLMGMLFDLCGQMP